MTNESIYDIWAPQKSRWSPWVKPVLFACMTQPPAPSVETPENWDATWAPLAGDGTALVLDLPGAEGVAAGLALAARGYRPVPLYNAIPAPVVYAAPTAAAAAVVDLSGVAAALWHGAGRLQQLQLPPDAPPTFLLDWNRRGPSHNPAPGQFDNRSISFTTDFPSGNFLLAHSFHRVVLVHPLSEFRHSGLIDPNDEQPQSDLAHTLLRWQQSGIAIELRRAGSPETAVPLRLSKPPWFGWVFQRAIAALGLRRGRLGGFGAWVPEPSSG